MSEYPRRNDSGETVWACCESSIGPMCEHRTPPVATTIQHATVMTRGGGGWREVTWTVHATVTDAPREMLNETNRELVPTSVTATYVSRSHMDDGAIQARGEIYGDHVRPDGSPVDFCKSGTIIFPEGTEPRWVREFVHDNRPVDGRPYRVVNHWSA